MARKRDWANTTYTGINEMGDEPATLYQIATLRMQQCIDAYLSLSKDTNGLSSVEPQDLLDNTKRQILLAGLGVGDTELTAEEATLEWMRRRAVPFDLEQGITFGVYQEIRKIGDIFWTLLEEGTEGLTKFNPNFIKENPFLLPLLQHVGGIFSKAALKKLVGAVSDTSISQPAAERLAGLLDQRVDAKSVNKGEVLQRLESTLEGIVRDLVGRLLFESIVERALIDKNVPFMREKEYEALSGVVYDFRADFVLPNSDQPKAFIEVRKSSSRHASLYAKDKMFSAINWKGHNTELLAIIVVDGPWTKETLRVMANIFDYVMPISNIAVVTDIVDAYLRGDTSKLKWLINFQIEAA